MPRAKEPSAATKWLAAELAQRGVAVSPRALEGWAARGIAHPPARRSLGRGRGMASEYPPGAVDHYAAVASVMRRGLPWQVSVLKLLARGYLPADPDLIHQALRELLTPAGLPPDGDALDRAEHAAALAAPGHPFIRTLERNLRRATGILEPGTQVHAAAEGVLATLNLVIMGESAWSQEALTEMTAALGYPVATLSDTERGELARITDAFFTHVITGPALIQLAGEVPPERLLAAIPQGQALSQRMFESIGDRFPRPGQDVGDVLAVVYALMLLRIEDFGGDDAIAALFQRALSSTVDPRVLVPGSKIVTSTPPEARKQVFADDGEPVSMTAQRPRLAR